MSVSASSSQNPLFPPRTPLFPDQVSAALSAALKIQEDASTNHSKRPFAALLLAPDNSTILLTHFSISHIRHAESELARLASDHYDQTYLWKCTLVSTWEPCAMCAGTMYWANIGRLVYAASEEALIELTGEGNGENMGFRLPCRRVFEGGQKGVEIIGPVPEWEKRVVQSAKVWWDEHR
jgi:tRNA(Arg) A34 adenosine deaminase TadA